jgi:hypothetical protein
MIRIEFQIIGNESDPKGNPKPKLRKTGNQSWTPEVQRYIAWKNHVRAALIKHLREINPEAARIADQNIATCGKPLILGDRHATMDITISWKNDAHGDPENIFGSIADALFHNDKHLYGSFSPGEPAQGGIVRCIINVSEPAPKKPTRKLQAISEKRTWKHSSKNPASPRFASKQKQRSKKTS